MNATKPSTSVPPVMKAVTVPLSVQEAFTLFTRETSSWWPITTHSVTESSAAKVVFEERVGGHVYESGPSGEKVVWGTILIWEPPGRVVFTWHPGAEAATAQEVEVRFRRSGEDTVVDLEHRGWEILGEQGVAMREGYDNGWDAVLGKFFAEEAWKRSAR